MFCVESIADSAIQKITKLECIKEGFFDELWEERQKRMAEEEEERKSLDEERIKEKATHNDLFQEIQSLREQLRRPRPRKTSST